MADSKQLQSVIFYGPPGTGKTTAAMILANAADKPLYKLNGVSASTTDIKKIADAAPDTGCVLYLDEIQYFNKRQQQSLLPYIESGAITMIASTTENPYHDIYDAILSRCLVLEFKRLTPEDIYGKLSSVCQTPDFVNIHIDTDALQFIAHIASGDVRRSLNLLELAAAQYPTEQITAQHIRSLLPTAQMAGFDMDGGSHYGYISAMQKSIRGSDPDAAVFWLAKLLEGGDVISPCRRLLVTACEDIGLACPDAITHTYACTQAAQILGMPEARKPLTQAVIYLALAPKSCSNEPPYDAASEDIKNGLGATIPRHLRTHCAPGYVWPHQYPEHWVNQQYLPDDLLGKTYYQPGDNPFEQQAHDYWQSVRKRRS